MPLLITEELAGMKLSIIKDLEKTLKIGYEHQYRNILSKIVSKKKRFVKKRLANDISEDILRYDALAAGLTNYLVNLFNVFGESAVLKAKKTFEDNGCKWGKKLKKKLLLQTDTDSISSLIKDLYINVPEIDYIETDNGALLWHLSKHGSGSVNGSYERFQPRFYDIKAAWLSSFIKNLSSQYTGAFDRKIED
ncbi:MAG TPA: hypothetical protein VD757_02305, partial [Candidatus Nitrosocosmicus sp.]|nr:hypothetical protein [Candidatus Nitrosocosmicus sp.]